VLHITNQPEVGRWFKKSDSYVIISKHKFIFSSGDCQLIIL